MQLYLAELLTQRGLILGLYLIGLLAFFSRLRAWLPWSAPIYLPGTVLHEALHYAFALLMGAAPRGFSFWPTRQVNAQGQTISWCLGQVSVSHLNWWNAVPTALAPALLLVLALIYGIPQALAAPSLIEASYWVTGVAYCLWSGWPSPQDWRLVLQSPLSVGFYGLLGWLVVKISS